MSQEGRPVAYFSEKLNDAKRKYFVYDQGCYVVIQALKKWRHFLLPKEFFLYTDHQTLQYLNCQGKLNKRNLKSVDFLQSYTFFLKHRSGKSNRVVDGLRRRQLFLTEMKIEVVGFKEISNLYLKDPNFGKACKDRTKPITLDRTKWLDFIIQDGMMFKGS